MTKKTAYTVFYSLLGVLLLGQIVYTIYQSSLVVSHGVKQSQLQQEQAQLTQRKQKLQAQLATQRSLLQYDRSEVLAQYQQITNPLVVSVTSNLAVAQ